jgi:hypothetical protein
LPDAASTGQNSHRLVPNWQPSFSHGDEELVQLTNLFIRAEEDIQVVFMYDLDNSVTVA